MIIQLKIEKEHFYFIVALIAVLFAVGVSASVYKNPINKVGHDANETGPGIFGGTFTNWFTFPGNLRINNSLNVSGNITFENKAKITATQGLMINSTNVTVTNNLTLGGISRDSWPSGGVATSQLPAENVTAGTFGLNVGGGLFKFGNLTASNVTAGNLTVKNNITLGGVTRNNWTKETNNLSARNISSGTFGADVSGGDYAFPNKLNITSYLLFPNDITGIYWISSVGVGNPHIEYSSASGLWISSGAGSGKKVNVEGDLSAGNISAVNITTGNLSVINSIATGNITIMNNATIQGNLSVGGNITFGGVTRGSWPAEFPQGFCIFSRTNTTCPGGWTRSISLDGRTIRGWSPPGGTGGSDTHIHWIAPPLYYSYQHGTGSYAWTYGVGANSGPGDSWPPYTNVLICCKN